MTPKGAMMQSFSFYMLLRLFKIIKSVNSFAAYKLLSCEGYVKGETYCKLKCLKAYSH